jgi:hypothetical protein
MLAIRAEKGWPHYTLRRRRCLDLTAASPDVFARQRRQFMQMNLLPAMPAA